MTQVSQLHALPQWSELSKIIVYHPQDALASTSVMRCTHCIGKSICWFAQSILVVVVAGKIAVDWKSLHLCFVLCYIMFSKRTWWIRCRKNKCLSKRPWWIFRNPSRGGDAIFFSIASHFCCQNRRNVNMENVTNQLKPPPRALQGKETSDLSFLCLTATSRRQSYDFS